MSLLFSSCINQGETVGFQLGDEVAIKFDDSSDFIPYPSLLKFNGAAASVKGAVDINGLGKFMLRLDVRTDQHIQGVPPTGLEIHIPASEVEHIESEDEEIPITPSRAASLSQLYLGRDAATSFSQLLVEGTSYAKINFLNQHSPAPQSRGASSSMLFVAPTRLVFGSSSISHTSQKSTGGFCHARIGSEDEHKVDPDSFFVAVDNAVHAVVPPPSPPYRFETLEPMLKQKLPADVLQIDLHSAPQGHGETNQENRIKTAGIVHSAATVLCPPSAAGQGNADLSCELAGFRPQLRLVKQMTSGGGAGLCSHAGGGAVSSYSAAQRVSILQEASSFISPTLSRLAQGSGLCVRHVVARAEAGWKAAGGGEVWTETSQRPAVAARSDDDRWMSNRNKSLVHARWKTILLRSIHGESVELPRAARMRVAAVMVQAHIRGVVSRKQWLHSTDPCSHCQATQQPSSPAPSVAFRAEPFRRVR
jgi:hypothetical protein